MIDDTPVIQLAHLVSEYADSAPAFHSKHTSSASFATMPPDFVSGDYFCESGFNTRQSPTNMLSLGADDPLWDGQNCSSTSSCCNHYPYFIKCLATPTTEDIEVRILNVYPSPNSAGAFQGKSDIAVEQIELYVQ